MAQLSSRRRRWPRWLLAAVIVLPVLEIVVLLVFGKVFGVWPLVIALVLGTLIGGALLAREGPRSWRSLRAALRFGPVEAGGVRVARPPTRVPTLEIADGALVLVGAILLLAPGLVSDVLGICCLLPFTRRVPRRVLVSVLERRAAVLGARLRGVRDGPVPGQVVQGRVVEPPRPPQGQHDRKE